MVPLIPITYTAAQLREIIFPLKTEIKRHINRHITLVYLLGITRLP